MVAVDKRVVMLNKAQWDATFGFQWKHNYPIHLLKNLTFFFYLSANEKARAHTCKLQYALWAFCEQFAQIWKEMVQMQDMRLAGYEPKSAANEKHRATGGGQVSALHYWALLTAAISPHWQGSGLENDIERTHTHTPMQTYSQTNRFTPRQMRTDKRKDTLTLICALKDLYAHTQVCPGSCWAHMLCHEKCVCNFTKRERDLDGYIDREKELIRLW